MRTPDWMLTFLMPLVWRALRIRSMVGAWSVPRSLHTVGWMQESRRQTFSTSGLVHRMRYMLAVGPPRSLMWPLNSGSAARFWTSLRIEVSLRFWITRPWCMVIEQKVQPPKHPRMMVTESLIIVCAGMGSA